MGFGRCLLRSTAPQNTSNGKTGRKPRVHCDSYYWDISSVIIKTVCLATFFVVESPRRIVSYVSRRPEPKPFFTCHKWGYRVCACGHHYYDHQDVSESEKLFSTRPPPNHRDLVIKESMQRPSDGIAGKTGSVLEKQKQKNRLSTQLNRNEEIVIKGGSVKDFVDQIAGKSAVARKATPMSKSSAESPERTKPVMKKRRRRWYWPF